MTFKKLISTVVASAMALSAFASVVSAAVEFNWDDGYYITNVADVADRLPYIETAVKQLSQAEVTALANTDGVTNKKWKATNYGNTANWTVYQIDGTVKNVGQLGVGYDDSDNTAFIKLKAIDATLNFSQLTALGTKGTHWDAAVATTAETNTATAWSLKNLGSKGGCFLQLLNPFPDESETANGNLRDLEYKYTIYVVVPKGSSVTLPFDTDDAAVQYNVYNGLEGYTGDLIVNPVASRSAAVVLSEGPSTVDVTGVTLDKSALELKVGGTYDLTETVKPDDATDKSVSYSSNNTAVATVDAATGVVTAVAKGTATITVTTTDGGKTATCEVKVLPVDVVPAAADKKVVSNATADLVDVNGTPVTIDSSRSYGAAKFDSVQIEGSNYIYKVVATGTNNTTSAVEEKVFDIAEGDLEVSGTASFIAIVRSATHTITDVVLKAFAK